MMPLDVLGALVLLAERAFAGRVLLSLLPPGLPGRHGFREIPSTWAASHLLGSSALLVETRLLELLGLAPRPAVLLAPWLLLALARWITLPGAIVPRHEPLVDSPGPAAHIVNTAAFLLLVAGFVYAPAPNESSPARILHLADTAALLALVAFSLSAARRDPLGRAWCLLALAAVLAAALATSHAEPFPLALCLGAGASLGIPWLRRADRRAAALAAIAFSSCALQGPRASLYGAAGLFALWVHTPSPSRPSLATLSAVLLALCAALGFLPSAAEADGEPILTPRAAATLLVAGFALATRHRLLAARAREADPGASPEEPVDPTRPQAAAMRDTVLLCIFVLVSRSELASPGVFLREALPLAPLLAIEAGLLLLRPELPLAFRRSTRADSPGDRR